MEKANDDNNPLLELFHQQALFLPHLQATL